MLCEVVVVLTVVLLTGDAFGGDGVVVAPLESVQPLHHWSEQHVRLGTVQGSCDEMQP